MQYILVAAFTLLLSAYAGTSHAPTLSPHQNTDSIATKPPRQTLLTSHDFHGWGLLHKENIDPKDETFQIQIHPHEPFYTFHIVSFSTSTAGRIDIFRGERSSKPIQTLSLDPNAFLADRIPLFFNVTDINFDGYADIGIVADGGTLWGAYRYWVFDPNTKIFLETPFTKDVRAISFNEIAFYPSTKHIVTKNIFAAIGQIESSYLVEKEHLLLVREETKEGIDLKH